MMMILRLTIRYNTTSLVQIQKTTSELSQPSNASDFNLNRISDLIHSSNSQASR